MTCMCIKKTHGHGPAVSLCTGVRTRHVGQQLAHEGRIGAQRVKQLRALPQRAHSCAGGHGQVGRQAGREAVAQAAQALVVHHLPGTRAEAALRGQRIACAPVDPSVRAASSWQVPGDLQKPPRKPGALPATQRARQRTHQAAGRSRGPERKLPCTRPARCLRPSAHVSSPGCAPGSGPRQGTGEANDAQLQPPAFHCGAGNPLQTQPSCRACQQAGPRDSANHHEL